ncbi:hypothetical protein M3Y95_00244700 [Aphelenchoides besseyi]|nr:hypothetical protein M3Y95_00244700 [Aphelenchoides besseyi]
MRQQTSTTSDPNSDGGKTPSERSERSALMPKTPSFRPRVGKFLHDFQIGINDMTLEAFTRRLCAMNVYRVFFDYTTVIMLDVKEAAPSFDKHPELSRYSDISCREATRVRVPVRNASKPEHDFIHANYVDGFREPRKFILTQAPLSSTIEQFWRMVWQEKSTMVVALTIIDGINCPTYLPTTSGHKFTAGTFVITHAGTRHIRESYDATVLMVSNGNEPVRKIVHITFYTWPDKGTPTRPTEVLYLLEDMNFNRKLLMEEANHAGWLAPNEQSPTVVHCVAGVGRSGAFVALDICARRLDGTFNRPFGPLCDVRDTVLRIRTQREMAIQKAEQFLFIHLAVVEYALRQRLYDTVDAIDLTPFMMNSSIQ